MSNRAINWVKSLDRPKGYKAVLNAMADSANEYMATWPSRATVARRTGYKEDTVRDYQNAMVKDGTLIAVPWQTEKGADAAPGYFLGCVRELFDDLPAPEVAFAKRINFKGAGKGGGPRGYTPDWWSGKRVGGGHRCTCCGGLCHGGETDAEALADGLPGVGLTSSFDPPQGRNDGTLEGRNDATLPGGCAVDPFNPKESKPKDVVPNPRANAEAFARPVLRESASGSREGWGVWGEGSATEAADAGPLPVTACAGAPAGDGLRPRGSAAPATKIDQSGDDEEPMPPPVAEVLKNAATGEPSQHPGLGDLVPRQIRHAQQAYEPAAKPVKPPRWDPDRKEQRGEEWGRIIGALMDIDDDGLNRLETAVIRTDGAALNQARAQAFRTLGVHDPERESEAAFLRRGRLYGLIFGLNMRPLSSWPTDLLPAALRGPESTEAA